MEAKKKKHAKERSKRERKQEQALEWPTWNKFSKWMKRKSSTLNEVE